MSVKIVYRPVKPNDKKGYLKVRIIENRKAKFKTLGIKISGKNWMDDKQRVSRSEPNADSINEKITETLKELSKFDDPTQAIKTNTKTVLNFYDDIINITVNTGTRTKYKDVKNRFKAYLQSIDLDDLKLYKLNPNHVQSFLKYMRENGCSTNTSNYNIKSFKAIINKAIKSDLVTYTKDPFALFKPKYTETKHKSLTFDEVKAIIKTEFTDNRKKRYNSLGVNLREIADTFLFQIFAQGMRVSDIQLLKWENFTYQNEEIYVEYTQFKTNKKINLKLTLLALSFLNIRLNKYDPLFSKTINAINEKLNEAQTVLKEVQETEQNLKIQKELDERIKYNDTSEYNERVSNRLIEEDQLLLRKLSVNSSIERINKDLYKTYGIMLDEINNQNKSNDYVFYFFENDKVFENYKSGMLMSEEQYKSLQGKRAYYNVLLKEIQKQVDIKTNISSHLARHTYTQLILNSNADLLSVSKALGHSHISTTQTYISQFPNAKLLDINDGLSDAFQ